MGFLQRVQGRRIGDRLGEAGAPHGLARLGRATDVTARLGLVAAEIGGDLARARAAHARALAGDDPDALLLVSEAFDTMGADLLAAEADAADPAVAWQRAGDSRRAVHDAGEHGGAVLGRARSGRS